ncbi:unnamed protein product [Anisakis simplex]|uniref:Uncharacterized protein n=1 Tax=Anisakis simplex TaxID=6269 RepID=A0A3P6U7X4_ANISI|nr:unnamed protein product [Anisakis simplex]
MAPSAKWAPETAAMHAIDYEMSARLDAETRRSEEYRFQCEQLKAEIQHLRQQFELNLQDKERIYQNRERVCLWRLRSIKKIALNPPEFSQKCQFESHLPTD